jgi:hypothetical protein
MKAGKNRFDIQLNKIDALFKEAHTQENPALWLFLHDLRTPLFMLEGLSKLYAQLHNKKDFTKLKETLKILEDILGAIDYYAAFVREFSSNDKIPAAIKSYLTDKTKEKIAIFNANLIENNWLNGLKINEIRKQLGKLDWQTEAQEIKELKSFYQSQIQKIHEFVDETTFVFDNVESDVHELRRKIRWLSIYPQGLLGVVKLEETKPLNQNLNKYLTEKVINSPFNQLPVSDKLSSFLFLEKNHFLAMSWMIAELGKIKDDGLRIKILKDAIQEISFLSDENAFIESYKLLGDDYPEMSKLLNQAGQIAKSFFKDMVLDGLVL